MMACRQPPTPIPSPQGGGEALFSSRPCHLSTVEALLRQFHPSLPSPAAGRGWGWGAGGLNGGT